MRRILDAGVILLLSSSVCLAVQDVTTAIQGTVKRVDSSTKILVIKTADGTEHALHFVRRTSVYGADAAASRTKDAFHGLKEGSEVVAHYTARSGEETAEEVDRIGSGGLRTSAGTVAYLNRTDKMIILKAADGTEETYRLTDRAAKDAIKEIAEGSGQSAKVTVYYTQEAGQKIAHFFKATL